MALLSAACPRCGAGVQLNPQAEYVTCTYCGASAFVLRPGAVPPPNVPVVALPGAKVSKSPLGCILIGAGLMVLVLGGSGAAYFMLRGRPKSTVTSTTSTTVVTETREETSTSTTTTTKKEAKPPRLEGRRAPLLGDVNGDGTEDLVLAVSFEEDKGFTRRYAAFDGKNGKELWRTVDLGSELFSSDAALAGGKLLLSSRSGKITALDTTKGAEVWSATVGERVEGFCRGKGDNQVQIQTSDKRTVALDLASGAQSPVPGKPACERVSTTLVSRSGRDLRDRSDSRAPAGVKSVVCGGLRVMGDQNFTLPEQCKAQVRIDPDKLDGMSARALWQHRGGYLAIGQKQPGTRVPMIGFVKGGKLVWKVEVPEANPLEAREGAPDHVTLQGDTLFVAYEPQAGDKSAVLTALDASSGKRLWTSTLPPKARSVLSVKVTEGALLVTADDRVFGLGKADGKQLFMIGDGR